MSSTTSLNGMETRSKQYSSKCNETGLEQKSQLCLSPISLHRLNSAQSNLRGSKPVAQIWKTLLCMLKYTKRPWTTEFNFRRRAISCMTVKVRNIHSYRKISEKISGNIKRNERNFKQSFQPYITIWREGTVSFYKSAWRKFVFWSGQ